MLYKNIRLKNKIKTLYKGMLLTLKPAGKPNTLSIKLNRDGISLKQAASIILKFIAVDNKNVKKVINSDCACKSFITSETPAHQKLDAELEALTEIDCVVFY